MKRLTLLLGLVAILVSLALFGISDSVGSITDTDIPDNEITSSVNETANSASATITITMYAVGDE